MHYCKINFNRRDDLHEFEKAFTAAKEGRVVDDGDKDKEKAEKLWKERLLSSH